MFDVIYDNAWLLRQVVLFGLCGTVAVPIIGPRNAYAAAALMLLVKLFCLFGPEMFL